MFTTPKRYFFSALLLVGCAGSEGQDDPIVTDAEDTIAIADSLNTDESPTNTSQPAEGDENCDVHFASAMNRQKPDDLVIVHCEYWSSDHPVWLEHSYRFEFEKNELFFEDVVDYNAMVRIEDTTWITEHQSDWFLPKQIENYEGYYTEDDFDDFQLFKDISTGNIFIRGSQY